MTAIAKLKAMLGMDATQFKAGMKQSTGETKRFQSAIASAGRVMAGAFSIAAVVQLGRKIYSAGAELEAFREQWVALGADVKTASAHMKLLNDFAAKTPYALADIVNASQGLYTLSEGLMGGLKSMTLFGDAAAATGNKDLAGVTYWVGRLYASLASGRPFIDSANALMRLKIMAPSTMKAMIDLKEAGGSSAKVWDTFIESLDRFEGGMERLSRTMEGKTSTMKDNWTKAWGAMGEAMKPAINSSLDILTKVANKVEETTKLFQASAAILRAFRPGHTSLGQAFLEGAGKVYGTGGGKEVGTGIHMPSDAGGAPGGGAAGDKGYSRKSETWFKKLDYITQQYQAAVSRLNERLGNVGGTAPAGDSLAQVGGMVGAQRAQLSLADRQLRIQIEGVRVSREIAALTRQMNDSLQDLRDNTPARAI